jgi:hypothetical protein
MSTIRRAVSLPRPHRCQQTVIDEAKRFNVVVCGRRFGKTTLGIDRLIAPALEGRPVAWCSPTYRMMAETWDALRAALAPVIAHRNEQEHRLTLVTGGTIDLWSLEDPDTVRGRAYARVVIDEAAIVRDLERAWEQVLRPTLTDFAGDAWFLSTPKSLNYFHTLYRRGLDGAASDSTWRSWQFPTSANPHLPAAEIAQAERELPERTFAQEYLAQFIEDAGAVFRRVRDAVRPCLQTARIEGHRYVIGVDWARTNDFTVYCVVDTHERCVCALDRFQRIEYAVQLQRLHALADRFRPAVIVAERNSMGDPLAEQLRREGLPVWPFLTTSGSKREAIEALALAFERGEIGIPGGSDGAMLVHELLAFTAHTLPSGLLRYEAPTGGTDDCVMALAMGWEAIELTSGPHAVFTGHFNADRHVARSALEVEGRWPICRGWDVSAGVISVVWFQLSRNGKRLRVLYEQQDELAVGIDVAKRAALQVSALLYPEESFLDLGSAALWERGTQEGAVGAQTTADLFRPDVVLQSSAPPFGTD